MSCGKKWVKRFGCLLFEVKNFDCLHKNAWNGWIEQSFIIYTAAVFDVNLVLRLFFGEFAQAVTVTNLKLLL